MGKAAHNKCKDKRTRKQTFRSTEKNAFLQQSTSMGFWGSLFLLLTGKQSYTTKVQKLGAGLGQFDPCYEQFKPLFQVLTYPYKTFIDQRKRAIEIVNSLKMKVFDNGIAYLILIDGMDRRMTLLITFFLVAYGIQDKVIIRHIDIATNNIHYVSKVWQSKAYIQDATTLKKSSKVFEGIDDLSKVVLYFNFCSFGGGSTTPFDFDSFSRQLNVFFNTGCEIFVSSGIQGGLTRKNKHRRAVRWYSQGSPIQWKGLPKPLEIVCDRTKYMFTLKMIAPFHEHYYVG